MTNAVQQTSLIEASKMTDTASDLQVPSSLLNQSILKITSVFN